VSISALKRINDLLNRPINSGKEDGIPSAVFSVARIQKPGERIIATEPIITPTKNVKAFRLET
jgi:hypothetical protein